MQRDRKCVLLSEWPARDQELWARGTSPAGLFEQRHAGSDWSHPTRRKVQNGYGRWLRWQQVDGNADFSAAPADRVGHDVVDRYITDLSAHCAPYTVANRIQELYDAMRVMAPERDWSWLCALYGRLYARAEPVTDKRSRLHFSRELSELGRDLMGEVEWNDDLGEKERALQYRDGLIVALLAHRPFRTRNFATIRIGTHILPAGNSFVVRFDAAEMKGRRAEEVAFPSVLLPFLRRYLDHYRTILLTLQNGKQPPSTDALWISLRGQPLSHRSLANPVNKRTRAKFGESLPPHWFRHAAGTMIAIEASKDVADAQHILGHANPGTTAAYYNLARTLDAAHRFHQVVDQLLAEPEGKHRPGAA